MLKILKIFLIKHEPSTNKLRTRGHYGWHREKNQKEKFFAARYKKLKIEYSVAVLLEKQLSKSDNDDNNFLENWVFLRVGKSLGEICGIIAVEEGLRTVFNEQQLAEVDESSFVDVQMFAEEGIYDFVIWNISNLIRPHIVSKIVTFNTLKWN